MSSDQTWKEKYLPSEQIVRFMLPKMRAVTA